MSIITMMFAAFPTGPNTPPVTTDSLFNYVSLLLQSDGTTSTTPVYTNNTIVDSSYNSAVLARTGTPTQGTFSPFSPNGWSGYFNGTNSSLRLDGQTEFAFGSADFTIEMWVNIASVPAASTFLYDARPSGTAGGSYSVLMVSSTKELIYFAVGSNRITTPQPLNTNQWYHVAVSRSAGVTTMYLDGVAQGTWNDATTYAVGAARPVFGISGNSVSTYFNGYISNARIVNGTAVYTSDFTPSTTQLTAIAGTSLLTLQDNRFKDNSTNAFAITATGTPSVQALSPFPASAYSAATNGGSVYFNGTADFLSTSAINSSFGFGTGDFTVEVMVYPLASQQSAFIANNYNWSTGAGNWGFYTTVGAANILYFNSGSGNRASTSTVLIPLNQWSHVTYSRQGGTGRFFVNGVQIGTGVADATNYASTTGTMYIGDKLGAGGKLNGYMTNVRVVKGTALYTAAFTPPTAPLAITGNTALLVNGTASGIVDATGKTDLVTVGDAKVSTTQVKYGTGSMYFDGTGDYLQAPISQNFALGTGDFTVEAWVYKTTSAVMAILSTGAGTSTNPYFYLNNLIPTCYYNSVAVATGPSIQLNTWTHLAFVRSANVFKVYTDGVSIGGTSSTHTDVLTAAGPVTIGVSSALNTQLFQGYVDDLRVTKGYARYTADFTPPTQALPNSSATDPYFNYNSLLLQGDVRTVTLPVGKNNVFIDSSTNVLAITPTGTPTQGTFSPFSPTGWSGYFSGTDYLTVASNSAFDLGTNDFTLEWWQNVADFSVDRNAITRQSAASGWNNIQWFGVTNTSNTFIFVGSNGGGGSNFFASPPGVFTLNTWQHVAIVRHAGTWKMFVNGASVTLAVGAGYSASMEANTTSQPLQIGGYPGWYTGPKGGISNVRIVKGTAVYTSNFTPSTSPLTAIAGTSLLTLQSNRFKDNSTNNFAVTTTGTPSIQSTSPFAPTSSWSAATNGGSMFFGYNTDYVAAPITAGGPLDLQTGNWTMEAWVYPLSFSGPQYSCPIFATNTDRILLRAMPTVNNSAPLNMYALTAAGAAILGSSGTNTSFNIKLNEWSHVAWVRNGSTFTVYINGVVGATATSAETIGTDTSFTVGKGSAGGNPFWNGYIADARVTKSTAVYTSAFTPPTAPLTPIANTSLLLSGTNIGVTDAASKNDLKLIGGAQVNPNGKFGTGSLMLDGTTGYAQGTSNNVNFGTGDFTIEAWVYPTTRPNPASIYAANASGTGTGAIFNLNAAGALRLGSFTTNYVTSTGVVPLNQWTHVAVTRSGTSLRLFINGVIDGTATNATGFIDANPVLVGAYNGGGTAYFSGYIDDLRVTKGAARYTANFAVPTEPFPVQ